MKLIIVICLFIGLPDLPALWAQATPFTASWSFERTDAGTSSSGLVVASNVTYTGVNPIAINAYTTGYVNLGVNVQNWSTTACNQSEYIQFAVQPTGTATITLMSLSFAFARSAQGPTQLTVRSSADGFSSDIFAQTVTINYQVASITLNGAGFMNQANAITFRIYACNPAASGGTIKLDEIQLNATVLPVTLLSFRAMPDGNRVQLAWETASERNASHFRIERSYDLQEYVTVGDVAATGTTSERQYYGLTDSNPRPGANYYRLSQIDFNGMVHVFKPISVIVRLADPVVTVYPNPASPDRIHVRLWNADEATLRLLTAGGQVVHAVVDKIPGEATLLSDQPLSPGLYWLEVRLQDRKQVIKVIIP